MRAIHTLPTTHYTTHVKCMHTCIHACMQTTHIPTCNANMHASHRTAPRHTTSRCKRALHILHVHIHARHHISLRTYTTRIQRMHYTYIVCLHCTHEAQSCMTCVEYKHALNTYTCACIPTRHACKRRFTPRYVNSRNKIIQVVALNHMNA